jgi:hypothetical protein
MCEHVWRRVNEQSLFGGYFPVGWRCEKCDEYLSLSEMIPGTRGTMSHKEELVGAHGGYIDSASGKTSRRQVINRDTKEIEYYDK